MAQKPKNYLNNKDLLLEIHKSKNSFSSYTNEGDDQYDIIVTSIKEIPENIQQAKLNKIKSLSNKNVQVSENEIDEKSLIFRVITYSHIPLDPSRKKNPKSTAEHHVKLNFPPFQHWKYDQDGYLRCIGKSHWIGPVDSGHFSKTHGKPTEKLALMWMKLCERYCTRGNVRSYTYNDEMQGHALVQLVEVGLQFNEYKSYNPFSYFTTVISNACIRVINTEKNNQVIRDDILESNDMGPSYSHQHHYEWDYALKRNFSSEEIERMNDVQKNRNVHRPSSRG